MNSKIKFEKLRVACNTTSIRNTLIMRLRRFFVDTHFSYSISAAERKEIEREIKSEHLTTDEILDLLSDVAHLHSELGSIHTAGRLRQFRKNP